MRVLDSKDEYKELDHTKAGILSDDIIITHDEDTYHELAGMMLLENKPGIKILEPRETYSLEKRLSALVRISDEAATTTNTLVPRFASSLISVWNIFASTPVGLILGR